MLSGGTDREHSGFDPIFVQTYPDRSLTENPKEQQGSLCNTVEKWIFFLICLTLIKVACHAATTKRGAPTSRGRGGGARLFTTKILDF